MGEILEEVINSVLNYQRANDCLLVRKEYPGGRINLYFEEQLMRKHKKIAQPFDWTDKRLEIEVLEGGFFLSLGSNSMGQYVPKSYNNKEEN